MSGLAGLAAGVGVVAGSGLVGLQLRRSGGWSAGMHRALLPVLLLPWVAQQAALARLARSPSLNPLRIELAPGDLLVADLAAPALVAVLLALLMVFPRRTRVFAVALPVVALASTWWVTLPLYARHTLRGWFFLTDELAGPWPFTWHVAASALLAGYALPGLSRGGPPAPKA